MFSCRQLPRLSHSFVLAKQQLLCIKNAQNYCLSCQRGRLLISSPALPQELSLHAGESFYISSNNLVLVESLQEESLCYMLYQPEQVKNFIWSLFLTAKQQLCPNLARMWIHLPISSVPVATSSNVTESLRWHNNISNSHVTHLITRVTEFC